MTLHWPPRALGLGPPLNLLVLARDRRAELRRHAWRGALFGLSAALAVATIDRLFFGGITASRTPALDEHPTPAMRVAISVVGSIGEELYFRVLVATAAAALVWLVLRRLVPGRAVSTAQWAGTLAAALHNGLWHVGMGSTGDLGRVLAINMVGNVLYGWLYWRRGLETALLAHVVVSATLYLGMPLLR